MTNRLKPLKTAVDGVSLARGLARANRVERAGWAVEGVVKYRQQSMAVGISSYDPQQGVREKQSSRASDERALRSPHLASRVKAKNEAFASVARIARPVLSSARSLS